MAKRAHFLPESDDGGVRRRVGDLANFLERKGFTHDRLSPIDRPIGGKACGSQGVAKTPLGQRVTLLAIFMHVACQELSYICGL